MRFTLQNIQERFTNNLPGFFVFLEDRKSGSFFSAKG
jgi:hypothetical protein